MYILRSALTLGVFLSCIKKIDTNNINAVSRIQLINSLNKIIH